jgi:2-hydroxyglutarate dehydrogenase
VSSASATWDVAIVGAGIVGLALARELQRRDPHRRVIVLEREPAVAAHQTSHSSGVLHAGIYYPPGSLKARACVRGRALLEEHCARHGIPVERCGKLIVARHDSERAALDELERRGRANGVPGLRRLEGPAAIAEVEPHATGVAALHSPATGICDFAAVARALAADVVAAGGAVQTGFAVAALRRDAGPGGAVTLVADHPGARPVGADARGGRASGGEARPPRPGDRARPGAPPAQESVRARRIVGCAGLWSDRLAVLDGADPDPRIVPFRGGYLRLADEATALVRGLIYPVPDPSLPFLGVHLTRTVHGELWLGPTALLVGRRDGYRLRRAWRPGGGELRATLGWPGTWRVGRRWWRTALDEAATAARPERLLRAAAAYVPALRPEHVAAGPHPAGVRAQAVGRDGTLVDDFRIDETPAGLHVRNAPSPAATSSLALAELLADRVAALDR